MSNRVLIGDFGSGDYRIRASKPGYDVTSALVPEQLAFDSTWKDMGVIYSKNSVLVSKFNGSNGNTLDIPFGETMTAIPYVLWWKKDATGVYRSGDSDNKTAGFLYLPPKCIPSTTGISFERMNSGWANLDYVASYIVIRGLDDG